MTVNLSYFAGAGWQFFDNNGVPLAGGLVQTYLAGSSTPATTYTTSAGTIQNSNPIHLDSAGRLANEIWLTSGSTYKFVLKDSAGNLIGTYDDIPGVNDVTSAINSVYANLANTIDPAKGDAYIGFRQSNSSGNLAGAVGRTVHEKFQSYIDVKDFGAVGDGIADDSTAFQDAVTAAIATTGEVFVPAGAYLIGTAINIPFVGGVKIRGVSNNSLGTKSLLLQKSIEVPVFNVEGINVSMSGLSFTTWAGNIKTPAGDPITCVSVTSNSMTLSADPWPGTTPVVWDCTASPQIATDGTPYTSVIQIALYGSFYASSATKNLDGTVTLNNVKGANGTLNSALASAPGNAIAYWVALANAAAAPVNPNAGILYLSVKENHFYDHLWFNQVSSCFTLSALGSGGGPGIGVGNVGFMSDIVCDGAKYFMKGLGDINNLQCVNSQFFGCLAFYAPYGSVTSSTFANNQVILGAFIQANSNIYGCTIVGNNFNAISGYGYSNLLINHAGTMEATTIVGNNFGRSTTTCIQTGGMLASTLAANNITSNGELGSEPWLYVDNNVLNSYLGENNFAGLYVSNNNHIGFRAASPSVAGSTFGGEWIGYQTGTKVIGWLPVTFQNSWANVGAGTPPVTYYKDQNGVVTVYGSLTGGSSGTVAFTLPAGYRPAYVTNRFAGGVRYDGSTEQLFFVEVDNSGNVTLYGTVVSWANLNFSFPTR